MTAVSVSNGAFHMGQCFHYDKCLQIKFAMQHIYIAELCYYLHEFITCMENCLLCLNLGPHYNDSSEVYKKRTDWCLKVKNYSFLGSNILFCSCCCNYFVFLL